MADLGEIYRKHIAVTVEYAEAIVNMAQKLIGNGLQMRFDQPIKRTFGIGTIVGLENRDNDIRFIDENDYKTLVCSDLLSIQELADIGDKLEAFKRTFCREPDCTKRAEDA